MKYDFLVVFMVFRVASKGIHSINAIDREQIIHFRNEMLLSSLANGVAMVGSEVAARIQGASTRILQLRISLYLFFLPVMV